MLLQHREKCCDSVAKIKLGFFFVHGHKRAYTEVLVRLIYLYHAISWVTGVERHKDIAKQKPRPAKS